MEEKDSDIKFKLNSAPQEDYIDDEDDLHWNKKKRSVGSRLFKMPEDIPYSWVAIGCLLLIVLFILIRLMMLMKRLHESGSRPRILNNSRCDSIARKHHCC